MDRETAGQLAQRWIRKHADRRMAEGLYMHLLAELVMLSRVKVLRTPVS